MLVALFILNALLALAFLGAGAIKIVRPRKAVAAGNGMGWAADFSSPTVKLIGVLEVLGAIGLIVPLANGIAVVLTPLAAVGLLLLMVGGAVVHIRRSEPPVPAVVLAVLSAVSAVLGFLVLASAYAG